jgi:hypothetical protein
MAARRQGDDEIGGEEGRLHQHRLGIAQREQVLQLGDDDVVQAGDAAEDEEQGEDEDAQAGDVRIHGGVALRSAGRMADLHKKSPGGLVRQVGILHGFA